MFKSNKKLCKLFCETAFTLDDDDFNAFIDFFDGMTVNLERPEYYEEDLLEMANLTKFAIENSKPIYKFIDLTFDGVNTDRKNTAIRLFYLIPGTAKEISSKLEDYIKLRHFK